MQTVIFAFNRDTEDAVQPHFEGPGLCLYERYTLCQKLHTHHTQTGVVGSSQLQTNLPRQTVMNNSVFAQSEHSTDLIKTN